MKSTSRMLAFTVFALFAAATVLATMGCRGGSMGRAGSQVDRSASKVGKVFRK